MIKLVLHKIISLSVIFAFLLPIGIEFTHSFEKHEHIICNSIDNQHIHNQEIDCSFCHFHHNFSSTIVEYNFKLNRATIIDEKPLSSVQQNYKVFLYFNSSRGPPYFIV